MHSCVLFLIILDGMSGGIYDVVSIINENYTKCFYLFKSIWLNILETFDNIWTKIIESFDVSKI